MLQSPLLVLQDSLKRESGSKVQHANIQASKAVADIVRTTLGPRSMLKMLLDAGGGELFLNVFGNIFITVPLQSLAAKAEWDSAMAASTLILMRPGGGVFHRTILAMPPQVVMLCQSNLNSQQLAYHIAFATGQWRNRFKVCLNNPGIPLVAIMANESSYNERGLDCELGFGLRDEALDPWYPWVIPYAGTAYMLLLLQHHNQRDLTKLKGKGDKKKEFWGWGIVVTNDGNAILRELDLAHPAAKSMIELSRTQDEEVGDGTTSVIVLAGEMLHVAKAFIDKDYHPTIICRAYNKALEDAIAVLDKIAMSIDLKDRAMMLGLIKSCIGTKFTSQFGDLIADLALDATTVGVDLGQGLREVDIKKYIKVEKVPGGQLEDSKVLKGVMINKDVIVPGKMRRKIVNPRIILLDCPLEYKKGENQTNAELVKEEDWSILLKMEEEYIESLCVQILKFKPDLVITEKGLSDLACHYLSKAGVSAFRRLRKTDNNRIARACGAVIVNRPDELQESDVGTGAGLFEVKKIGDEFFAYIVDCKDPKACTVLLRGASKDLLNEVERNLQDAMAVARNIIKNPKLVPGGGAAELTVSAALKQKSSSIEGIEKWPYEAAAVAFEAIPRTLAQNCGVNVIRTMTALQGKHANGENAWIGIDGNTGVISDMKERKIWDAYNVKEQTFKTAIEAACMLLRIDDIVSGIKKKQAPGAGQAPKPKVETEGDADNEQILPD
uniref:T-complex protein 1 subunit gamma n=1 Tax=Quercus lobata TaxID=97700 RepID=A0A7N2LIV1_QUELO